MSLWYLERSHQDLCSSTTPLDRRPPSSATPSPIIALSNLISNKNPTDIEIRQKPFDESRLLNADRRRQLDLHNRHKPDHRTKPTNLRAAQMHADVLIEIGELESLP